MTNLAAPAVVPTALHEQRMGKQPYVSIDEVFGNDTKVVRMATQSNKTLAMRSRGSLRSRLVDKLQGFAVRAIVGKDAHVYRQQGLGQALNSPGSSPWNLSKRDRGLIGFMIRERHGVPFEHLAITFKIVTNIRVAREHQRHRIGSFSELSSRWVEMSMGDAYVPERKAIRGQIGKRAEYKMQHLPSKLVQDLTLAGIWASYAASFGIYRGLLKLGVAKELAAYTLPLGTQTEYYWTVNLRSLWNFLSLRNAPTALYEIREIAKQVEEQSSWVFPVCFELWNTHQRPVV